MSRFFFFTLLATSIINHGMTMPSPATEIRFVEDFALTRDREQALDLLVPGSEDYFYFHCLNLQNTERFDEVEQLLKRWVKAHGNTSRVRQIQHRQALLTYEQNPKKTLRYLESYLNLNFSHQREKIDQQSNLPTRLDPNLIRRERLSKIGFRRHRNLDGFTNSAFEWLIHEDLNPIQRRHLLERLSRPDYANLTDLVVKDLRHKGSRGFGSLKIHRMLLIDQLNACLDGKPDLLNQTPFVHTYLAKLTPNEDIDWENDEKEHAAYLDRLWKFTQQLEPVHNSLKAHVLYHKLVLNRIQDTYDKQLFLRYLKIPRRVGYLPRPFRESSEAQRFSANLGQDYAGVTLLPAVREDEPLVRDYLSHFFKKANDTKAYQPYVDAAYLRELFAETKIVNGLGDVEKYYAMLSPEKYRALRDRVELIFAPSNQLQFRPDDPVSVDLYVKNVETLIVKVYEINTRNYYRQLQREVNTDVNLDGLVANFEKTHAYKDGPLRRIRRHFEFPELKKPGTYVIDFIGNGQSSRVVVRKGRLQYTEQTTADGHVFNIIDENDSLVPDASLWVAGHEYTTDGNGDILVPFTTEPHREAIVLTANGRSSLHFFHHQAENYQLESGIYVDRESLIRNHKATVVVRPSLKVNGTPVSITNLTEVGLRIASTDHDGTVTTQHVADFQLFEDRESEYIFQVPPRLASISFHLTGTVKVASTGQEITPTTSATFAINGIQRSDKIDDIYIAKIGNQYLLELLGRTGEPKPHRSVRLRLKHRDFGFNIDASLQTDTNGRIRLGELTDIEWLTATPPSGQSHQWRPQNDQFTYRRALHAVEGAAVLIPHLGTSAKPLRSELSLLELRGETFTVDHFEKLSIHDGYVRATGLTAGDYDLWLKRSNHHVRIVVTKGKETDHFAFGAQRHLELRHQQPLHIASIQPSDDKVTIQLGNVNPFARIHVFASRFEPEHDAFALLSRVRDAGLRSRTARDLKSFYLAGRNIGDEYQYILDRRYAEKFPGNMLERPSLLLNPWDIRSTETGEQLAEKGEAFAPSADADMEMESEPAAAQSERHQAGGFRGFDFLANPAVVFSNLIPNQEGVVTIDISSLRGRHQLQVVAVDPLTTVRRSVALNQVKSDYQDLRLIDGLDPQKHFTQQKRISVVRAGEAFRLRDITSSQFAAYDSLESVYQLYRTLSGNALLSEFNFIIRWPEMDDVEKQEKYSQYACHELNFFIFRKDPDFFAEVVRPYLANKFHKTFLDEWLLQHDLHSYLEPWNYARLNTAERILLGHQIGGEKPHARRYVNEAFELLPPNIDRWNHLFGTALRGQSLADDDRFGFAGRSFAESAKKESILRKNIPAPQAATAAEFSDQLSIAGGAMAANKARVDADKSREESRAMERAKRKRRGLQQDNDLADELDRGYFFSRDARGRKAGQFFRKLDKTKEWVENNYYRLPIQQQDANLVTVNAFWKDFANYEGDAFLSTEWAGASRSFTEMMLALSVLDLPFRATDHDVDFDGIEMTLKAKTPVIVVSEEVREVTFPQEGDATTSVLVSQDFYRYGERHRVVNGEQIDNFVNGEFLVHTLYGGQVVVTNTSSTQQKIDVLLQVPVGAIPALNSRSTRSVHLELQPYHTQTLDFHFYFPAAGTYQHFPVHVAKSESILAAAKPRTFHVVDVPSQIDKHSWQYISQFGSNDDVREFLKSHNLQNVQLNKIAFRMRDRQFFQETLAQLTQRHLYDQTLWSYGIHHNDIPSSRQFLQHQNRFVNECGSFIESPLLTSDPVIRRSYEQMDYKPLVNARAHQLGQSRHILNHRFHAQYHRLMHVLSQRRELDAKDLMSVTYYLLLQDRVGEAREFFARVNAEDLPTRLQYDYFAAYLDCFSLASRQAYDIVAKYENHPVPRWRTAFANIKATLDEASGDESQIVDEDDRNQRQNQLATQEPNFEFSIDSGQIVLSYQNLENAEVNFYRMDLELLFSRNPFAQKSSGQFSLIQPNASQTIGLSDAEDELRIEMPETLRASNVLIEIVAGGKTKTETYYANSLNVRINENYGLVRVTANDDKSTGQQQPIPIAYVKAYARMKDGSVRFYKDGYTDVRGKFDYASRNTNELENVDRFSLLIMSGDRGAVVRETPPPKR